MLRKILIVLVVIGLAFTFGCKKTSKKTETKESVSTKQVEKEGQKSTETVKKETTKVTEKTLKDANSK